MKQKILCKIYFYVYKKWLKDTDNPAMTGKVVKVVNWRTAVVDIGGSRQRITPCFLWFD
jgi:hypothetical protein